MILADWAAVAIDNARVYETSERRRQEAERGDPRPRGDPGRRGRDRRRDRARARARADRQARTRPRGRAQPRDHAPRRRRAGRAGQRRPRRDDARHASADRRAPPPGRCSNSGRPERITDVTTRLRIAPERVRRRPMRRPRCWCRCSTAARASGVLAAFDRGEEGSVFSEDDEQLMRTFAASAATAVALAQSVQSDRLRSSLGRRRRRAPALGARAARRDAAGPRRPAAAALLGAARRRPAARAGGDGRGRRAHRAGDRATCARSSPSCGPPRWTSSACAPRSRRCSTATASRAASRSTTSSSCRPVQGGDALRATISRRPSTGSCRRRSRTSPSTPRRAACASRSPRATGSCVSRCRTTAPGFDPEPQATASGSPGCASASASPAARSSIDSGEQGTHRSAPACRRCSGAEVGAQAPSRPRRSA